MPEENDGVVEAFLEGHPDFAPARPAADFPEEVLDPKGYLRTFPNCHGTDGFFGALLLRR
jgi:16S rRNA (cytosine967-C5)-methyltransferase